MRKRIIIAMAGVFTLVGVSPAFAVIHQGVDGLGSVTASGGNSVEIDGEEGNAPSGVHSWLDGYAAVGTTENGGQPGICTSGDNNRSYFHEAGNPPQECNEALLDEDSIGTIGEG